MKLKTLATLFSLTLLFNSNAFAGFLKEGGFVGKQNGDNKVHLLLKEAPGRTGCFFAVLMMDNAKISLYSIDEINSQSYAMTPLEVTRDGEIGIVNDDPSLVISSSKGSDGQDIFKIMSANSSNNTGFTGFFEFNGKASKISWLNMKDGEYYTNEEQNALQLSQIDPHEKESTAVFLTKNINGTFALREKFPSMYLINKNSVLATGTQKSQIPSAIGIFLERKGFLGSTTTEMLLINPKNDTDVKIFTKK